MATETQALHQGLRLAQRYQLAERLDQGALATVYRGQDLMLRRPIAVKAVPPEHVSTYQAALKASGRLAHPAAICVYDALEQDGWLFVVQEYVAARPISAYFRQGLPVERAVDLARQVAGALTYAHMHDVTHGDLTPTAVLVDRHANVRVNNFGLPPDTGYFVRIAAAVAASLAADDPTIELSVTSADATPPGPDARLALASRAGDTRALSFMLWHLLTEPVLTAAGTEPEDGIRRFRAEVPRELREVVIGTIRTATPEPVADAPALALALERIGYELARGRASSAPAPPTPAAVLAARAAGQETSWSSEETVRSNRPAWSAQPPIRVGSTSAPPLPAGVAGPIAAAYGAAPLVTAGEQPAMARRGEAPIWGAPRPAAYTGSATREEPHRVGLPLMWVLLLGAVLFILFFLVGYFSSMLPGH